MEMWSDECRALEYQSDTVILVSVTDIHSEGIFANSSVPERIPRVHPHTHYESLKVAFPPANCSAVVRLEFRA